MHKFLQMGKSFITVMPKEFLYGIEDFFEERQFLEGTLEYLHIVPGIFDGTA